MWFPSSNNVSVIYEWPATIPAQPPRYSTISSPYHNKLRPNSAGTHSHTERPVCRGSVHTCACVLASVEVWLHVWTGIWNIFMQACVCAYKMGKISATVHTVHPNLPFGGGLTSVSPCWFELSDCPDCSETETREKRVMVSQVDRCLDTSRGEGAG